MMMMTFGRLSGRIIAAKEENIIRTETGVLLLERAWKTIKSGMLRNLSNEKLKRRKRKRNNKYTWRRPGASRSISKEIFIRDLV